MGVFLFALAIFLLLLGLIGAFLPALPGPPIAWCGLLLAFFSSMCSLNISTLVFSFILMILVTVADYIFPSIMTKKSGGSKMGTIGSTVGLVVGLFLPIPVIGVIFCPFFGAFIFELINDSSDTKKAFNSAWGAFLGFLLGTGIKAICVVSFVWIIILNIWKGWF